MKFKMFFGALVLSTGLCSQSFGFELLDTMLGLNGCGRASLTRARCCAKPCGKPKSCCAKVSCRPKRCCTPKPKKCCTPKPKKCCTPKPKKCCTPKPKTCCAKKKSCCRERSGCDLFAGLRGMFSCGCRSKCGCDAKPKAKTCCAPKKTCCAKKSCGCRSRCGRNLLRCCKVSKSCGSGKAAGGDAGADDDAPKLPPDPVPTDPSASFGQPRPVFQSATLLGS